MVSATRHYPTPSQICNTHSSTGYPRKPNMTHFAGTTTPKQKLSIRFTYISACTPILRRTHTAHISVITVLVACTKQRVYETADVDDTRYTSAPITLVCAYTFERTLAFDCTTIDNSCTQAYCSRKCVLYRPARQKHPSPDNE